MVVWIACALFALISFPVGLLIPGYLYIKADRGEAKELSAFEIWTVILLGIFGIAAVEIGGPTGAKIAWSIVIALFALFVLAVVALLLI